MNLIKRIDDSIVKNLNKEDKAITSEMEKLAQKFVKNNSNINW